MMPNPKRLLDALYGAKEGGAVNMQDGGDPTQMFNFNPMAAKAAEQERRRREAVEAKRYKSVMGTTPKDLLRRVEPPPAEMTETPQSVMPTTLDRAVVGGLRALGAPAPQARGINQLLSKSVGMLVPDPERIYNQMSEAVKEDDYSKMIGPSIDAAIGYVPLIGPAARLAMPPVKAATTSALDFGRAAGREMLRPIDQAMFGEGPLSSALSMAAPLNVNAPVSKLGFYNPIEEMATTLQRKQGPGQAFLNEFTRAGISKQRLEETGLAQKLAATPNVTREEVQAMTKGTMPDVEEVVLSRSVIPPYMKGFADLHMPGLNVNDYRQINQLRKLADERYQKALAENDLDAAEFAMKAEEDINKFSRTHSYGTKPGERLTEYHEYQEPGGKNYREVLLKVPKKSPNTNDIAMSLFNKEMRFLSEDEKQQVANESRRIFEESSKDFRSSHWSDPNVISHIRMNDRVDADNKNVLFIEELQSDWAQEGRKKGFAGKPLTKDDLVATVNNSADRPYWEVRTKDGHFIANTGLGDKEINAQEAVDEALQLVQTRGDKRIPAGPFVKNTNEWVDLSLKNIIRRAVDEGYDRVAFIDGYKSFLRFPQGADGESTEAGMRKFYDEIVPGRLKALVGKDNVRTIPGITQQRPLDVSLQGDRYYVVDADTDIAIPDHPGFRSLERAEQYLDELYSKTKSMDQIGFDITPEIREKFSKPIPYKEGGAVKRVHISDNPDTMLLELTRAPRMQEGGKPPPGVRRAMAQQRGTVAPIPGIKTPAEFIGGYVGADPRFSVMDPDADALERAYRAGEATSVIGDIVGSISPFATASTLARANALPGAAVVKGAAKKAFTARELKSETNKVAKAIAKDNPKMKPEDVQKRAATIAEKNLTWTKEQKPELEKTYGELVQAPASASVGERLQNVPEVVSQRARKAEEFLAQPTEPWQPPRPELQAFDRAMIKDAMEGFPGIEQTAFPRYTPPKADLSYIEEIYQDPRNRALIEAQIKRGLPLGGETFYASLYPMKMAALERGIPEEKFNQFIYSTAPASARNSIMNEMAVGQFLRDMNARGLPLDEETVKREMAAFKEKYGKGLPLMPIHREGVKNVLEGNLDLREQLKADIPINYKIPTYGTQKAGDFGKSVVLDVHEASGQTQGSRFHPYFSEQGGFGSREYGAAEQQMMDIAKGLGLPGGTAQAGRWFGGGELTGLVSPRGDALDLLERQAAYTLNGMGIKPTPRNVRNYLLDMIETGEGVLMPYYSKNVPMPDVRTEKKKGGAVKKSALDSVKRGYEYA
jgi:hypothetical protein